VVIDLYSFYCSTSHDIVGIVELRAVDGTILNCYSTSVGTGMRYRFDGIYMYVYIYVYIYIYSEVEPLADSDLDHVHIKLRKHPQIVTITYHETTHF